MIKFFRLTAMAAAFTACLMLARPVSADSSVATPPISQGEASSQEARSLWIVRYALSSPAAVSRIVRQAKDHRFNVLLVQVRGRGDAYYADGLEPRAEFLDKQPSNFDPLTQIIREAHAAGIQVHAWLNTFYVWSGAALPKSAQHVVNAHPEWLLSDEKGVVQYVPGPNREGAYIDPGNPEARKFVHDVFLDVARRYDVDGIHFDYVRYPGLEYGYSDGDLLRFGQSLHEQMSPEQQAALEASSDRDILPTFFPQSWKSWRRENVTDLVRSVYNDVKKVKPRMSVSASLIPWGVYHAWEDSDAYNVVTQNWFDWMREGLLDIAVPMTYHSDTPSFAGWIEAAVAHRHGTQIWAGIGSYLITPESTIEKIVAERRIGAQGFSLFSFDAITKDGMDGSYLQKVMEKALPNEAVVPPITSPEGAP